ncbi:hypothetical protein MBAV_001075 [Candidatus Magnetobacterium bavaricum]|uniref:Uncharacterized protein n=1 Tax=Candidatus Magnetobacterium bavaricum TaxID=29290 RepID=A0A0F3GXX7_9BACT|nr:hypothetical protein MBAV_001075 [Candidatus Magnetobacterium bavaricum]
MSFLPQSIEGEYCSIVAYGYPLLNAHSTVVGLYLSRLTQSVDKNKQAGFTGRAVEKTRRNLRRMYV